MQYLRRKLLMFSGLVLAQASVQAFPGMTGQATPATAKNAGGKGPVVGGGVVSLGGGITEIVYALGAGDRLIGVDVSSVYPKETADLPRVGYYRDIPVEGIAALRPSLVLASDQSGPDGALERLRSFGLHVEVLPDQPDLPALKQRIAQAATALGCEEQGRALLQKLQVDLDQWTRSEAIIQPAPRALSLMSHTGALLMAGAHTAADATLALAGFHNVMSDQQGYKPVTAEAALASSPDVVVTTELTVQALGGMDRMLAQPALAGMPAVRSGRVLVMADDLYLTFGPRLPQAVAMLRQAFERVSETA